MFALFSSEILRLRKGALICFLGLLTIYYMAPKIGFWDILHRNMGFLLTLGFIGLSLVFGIVHGILWRKKSFWVFLIHRPLAPRNIYLSLFGAGSTVIIGTVFLSLFITLCAYDGLTEKVVDLRHYQFAVYITLLSIACYMVGTLTVLHRSKFVILGFYALLTIFFPEPQNMLAQYAPLFLLLAALFYLNLQCFKPDLNQPIRSSLGTALVAAGTSYGLVVALIMATLLIYHLPLTIMGEHPDMNPQKGSMKYMWKDSFKNGIGYVLEDSAHPNAGHYARQASLATRQNLPIQQWQAPRHNQLHRFDNSDALINPDSGDIWKFSHDEMLLLGVDKVTQKSIGAIGLNGLIKDINDVLVEDRFTNIPHLSGGQYLSTESALYVVDFDTQSLILKHQPEADEYYKSSLWVGNDFAVISTNKKLLMFDTGSLQDDFSELEVDHQFSFPTSVADADYAHGMSVADGYILLFFGDNYFGFDRPGAEVFVTRLDGSSERLGGREFSVYDHPSWIRHYSFMVAPFIFVTEELLMHSIDPFETRYLSAEKLKNQKYPGQIYLIAILLQVMSLVALWLLLNRKTQKSNVRGTWLGLGFVLGLPALLSYLLLESGKE